MKLPPRRGSDLPAAAQCTLLCPNLKPVQELHNNPYCRFRCRGGYYTYEYHTPQVVILPVVDKKAIVMVRVFRPVINDIPLELPAGGCAELETTAEAARRELREETGIDIADCNRLMPEMPISEMPGRIPELLKIYRVDISMQEWLEKGAADQEIHSVHLLTFAQVRMMIVRGDIYLSSPAMIIARLLLAHG